MVQGEINRGKHTDHPAGRQSIRTNQCPPPPSPHTFLQAGCPSCRPTNSVKALKATHIYTVQCFVITDTVFVWHLKVRGYRLQRHLKRVEQLHKNVSLQAVFRLIFFALGNFSFVVVSGNAFLHHSNFVPMNTAETSEDILLIRIQFSGLLKCLNVWKLHWFFL